MLFIVLYLCCCFYLFLRLVFRNIFGWASVIIRHLSLLCNHYKECILELLATVRHINADLIKEAFDLDSWQQCTTSQLVPWVDWIKSINILSEFMLTFNCAYKGREINIGFLEFSSCFDSSKFWQSLSLIHMLIEIRHQNMYNEVVPRHWYLNFLHESSIEKAIVFQS